MQSLEAIKDLFEHKESSRLHLGHIWLMLMGFQDFATHFLDEVLSQDVVHIDNFPFLINVQVTLGIFSSCVVHRPFYLTQTTLLPSSSLSILAGFNERIMHVCEDITGPRL